ncbi:MAG: carbohydrate ABC transporter permease, partial [Alphaproteobacteria bacterium]|nr:carbohydrate ABC transporter permease [Alphaproteobacteria bacterium]
MIGYNTPFSTAAKHAVRIIGALIVILPFYIMATYSLKDPIEITSGTGGVFGKQEAFFDPGCVQSGNAKEDCLFNPIAHNYGQAFSKAPLLRYLFNGVVVTLSIFFIQVL